MKCEEQNRRPVGMRKVVVVRGERQWNNMTSSAAEMTDKIETKDEKMLNR